MLCLTVHQDCLKPDLRHTEQNRILIAEKFSSKKYDVSNLLLIGYIDEKLDAEV